MWPDDPQPSVRPETIRALLDEATEICPHLHESLVEIDCDEYPCGLYLRAAPDQVTECGRLLAPPGAWTAMATAGGDNGTITALWFLPEGEQGTSFEMVRRREIRFTQAKEM